MDYLIAIWNSQLFSDIIIWTMIVTGTLVWGALFALSFMWLWNKFLRQPLWFVYSWTIELLLLACCSKTFLEECYNNTINYPNIVLRHQKRTRFFNTMMWIISKRIGKPVPKFKYGLTIEKYNQTVERLKSGEVESISRNWTQNEWVLKKICKELNIKIPEE
jgi:hypothetical protein